MMDAHLYPASYFEDHAYGADPQRALAYCQERDRINQRVASGSIFDYGCGTGDFLATFGKEWRKYGFDISTYALKRATEKDIFAAGPSDILGDTMDVVVFRGTLQHISDPIGALRFAHRVLKHGGMLAILATPNSDSLCYRLFHDLPALDAPRNWFIPGAHELTNILRNVGFSLIDTEYPYWHSPYARPAHDLVCFALRLLGIHRRFAFPGNMMEVYCVK